MTGRARFADPGAEIKPAVWYEGREIAALLKVSLKTLQRAGVPNSRLSARRTLYLGRDITAWLEQRNTRPKVKRAG